MSSVSGKSDKLTIYRNQSEIANLPKPCYQWEWEVHVGERDSQCAYSVAYQLLRKGLIFREGDTDNHRTAQGVSDYLNSKGVELKDIDVDEDGGELAGTQTTLEGEEVEDVPSRNNNNCDKEIEDELALFDTSDSNQQTLDGEDAAQRVTDYVIANRWSAEIDSDDVDSGDVEQMKLIYDSFDEVDYNTNTECSDDGSEQVTLDSFSRKARFWARQGF